MNQSFTIFLADYAEVNDELANHIYSSIDDVTVGASDGFVHLDFDRHANSLSSAIDSAIKDLQCIGLRTLDITICNR